MNGPRAEGAPTLCQKRDVWIAEHRKDRGNTGLARRLQRLEENLREAIPNNLTPALQQSSKQKDHQRCEVRCGMILHLSHCCIAYQLWQPNFASTVLDQGVDFCRHDTGFVLVAYPVRACIMEGRPPCLIADAQIQMPFRPSPGSGDPVMKIEQT